MTEADISNIANESWLGRLRIYKPKKNAKIGIPYKAWHHLAIIDNFVFIYVWDTREIVDVYPISELVADMQTIKLVDAGKALRVVSGITTNRAANVATKLLEKYKELPITFGDAKLSIADLREQANDALLDINTDYFMPMEDAKVVFVDSSKPLPKNLYMFSAAQAINPTKTKLIDNNAYIGTAKYLAIIARCAILKEWETMLND